MTELALRLLGGGDDHARVSTALPVVAVAVATTLLLLTVAAWQGFDGRARRTSWLTPEEAGAEPFALQAVTPSFVDGEPLTIVHLGSLTPDAPAPPGLDRFPAAGELWVSPALKDKLAELPAAQLADRFGTAPKGSVGSDGLAHPQQLLAVEGHDPDTSVMRAGAEGWAPDGTPPTPIDGWSRTIAPQARLYRSLALLGVALMTVPLLALGGSATRLLAARRHHRLSLLRLIGGSVRQVVALTALEASVIAAAGAAAGVVLYGLALPLARRIAIDGGQWFLSDVWVGVPGLLVVAAGVVALVTASAVVGLTGVARDPLGTVRTAGPSVARGWRLGCLAAATVGFLVFGAGDWRTAALPVALVLASFSLTGPWLVKVAGLAMARTARRPARLLAGRRLAEDPRAGWRAVSGTVLAGFVAGFLAMATPQPIDPAELGLSTDLRAIVPAAQAEQVASDAREALAAAGIEADVAVGAPATSRSGQDGAGRAGRSGGASQEPVTVTAAGGHPPDAVRTALAPVLPGQGFRAPAEESIRGETLLSDITVGAAVVLLVTFTVAAVSAGIGGIARVLDQRGPLTLLRLAGAPVTLLASARRKEITAPLALFGGGAATLGGALGLAVALSAEMSTARGALLFVTLAALGVTVVLAGDLCSRPSLRSATQYPSVGADRAAE